jgi:hypothetical protein
MRSLSTHDFQAEREFHFEQPARSFLAIVDLDSYPGYVSANADRLDLLQHLSHEMGALTATMWEVPEALLRLELIWTPDDWTNDRYLKGGRRARARGSVRSSGRLCLGNDEQLLDRAHHLRGNLLRAGGKRHPHLLLVPSGIYNVAVYNGIPSGSRADPAISYTITLRHNPHPAPRLHPIRLMGLASPEQESDRIFADRIGHKNP